MHKGKTKSKRSARSRRSTVPAVLAGHEIKFNGHHFIVRKDKYSYEGFDRTALGVYDEDGDLMTVATINVPEMPMLPDEVVIKNYSENEGILESLIEAKIISEPFNFIMTGRVHSPICKLLI